MESLVTFDTFVAELREICEAAAKDKGYNNTGIDGKNDLYQFIQSISGSDSHAIGEIIYKAVRYSRKRDKKDLIKIAAWAFLIYKFSQTPE